MSKPKTYRPPAPVTPAPPPIAQAEGESSEDIMRRMRKKSGYEKTILAGELTPSTGKKTFLGG